MSPFIQDSNRLIFKYDNEVVWIEGWGENSLRIRATKTAYMPEENWALIEKNTISTSSIDINEKGASIKNGNITAKFTMNGKITFYNENGRVVLEEYVRNRKDIQDRYCSALEIEGREFKPLIGGDYALTMRFESNPDEKLYGMGQYQHPYLNLKGTELELAHRNSQSSVPFMISSLGYGLLWNNPAIGRVTFGKNLTSWHAHSTRVLDYWITVGNTPSEIEEAYAGVTGTVPMMPEYAMGFWQCKLRYQTQDELLEIAREYKKRGLPISVIVIDFFHWPLQGEWKFDKTYWPDPDEMIRELKSLGIELMVSVWPTVDYRSENFIEMKEKGYLIRTERGFRISMNYMGNTVHYDATNPDARAYLWEKIRQNYYNKGIKIFWLDEAEPEYTVYDFDNYRYYLGPNIQIGNIYPVMYAKTFFDGMRAVGQDNIINLVRCAWAGSQRYGALVWSGDIHSSFESLRIQLVAGLSMGIAGIPWWTTDIGGFHGGNIEDPYFRELLIRWFQYGTFCPVMRLHGDREPHKPQYGTTGGAECRSGADNEIWSFGEEAYRICKSYLELREKLKPYIIQQMQKAHDKGTPIMRPIFYDFPKDDLAWNVETQYMFGPDILVAPILYNGARDREVYLPKGEQWINLWTQESYMGGQILQVKAPLEQIPIFIRDKSKVFKEIIRK